MKKPEVLLEDTFTYKQVPFLIKVEHRKMYIHAKNGEVRGTNIHGNPQGMHGNSRKWIQCECVVARVRPDYPYSIENDEWEHIDQHHKTIDPIEIPKKGLPFSYYAEQVKDGISDVNEQELAQETIEKLKSAYKNQKPATLKTST